MGVQGSVGIAQVIRLSDRICLEVWVKAIWRMVEVEPQGKGRSIHQDHRVIQLSFQVLTWFWVIPLQKLPDRCLFLPRIEIVPGSVFMDLTLAVTSWKFICICESYLWLSSSSSSSWILLLSHGVMVQMTVSPISPIPFSQEVFHSSPHLCPL